MTRRAAARQAELDAIAARRHITRIAPRPPEAPSGPQEARTDRRPYSRTPDEIRRLEDDLETAEAAIDGYQRMLARQAARYRIDQPEAGYRPGTPGRNCGGCVLYVGGTCDLVRGPIDPAAVCDNWVAAG